MAVRFNRLLADARMLSPGEYSTETASGLVAICCRSCGAVSEIPEDREPMRGSDIVRLRWQCENEACSFAEFVQLESWLEQAA